MEEISLKDAAQRFGVKLNQLRRAAWDGRLSARQLSSQWVVLPSEAERFLREGGRAHATTARDAPREGDTMTRIISVTVPKGGTGKTTTTINLGAALAEQGYRVLLVDFDRPGNLTQALGLGPSDLEQLPTAHENSATFLSGSQGGDNAVFS